MTVIRERVLIVDDEVQVQKALVKILDHEGYRCITAGDLASACTILERAPFDLVLCDLKLPDGTGMQLLQEVAVKHLDTGVLMVTGLEDSEVAQEAIETGAFGYILKPFTANEVLTNVLGALRYAPGETSAEDELRAAQEETVRRLAMAIEARDTEAGTHIGQMSNYCWHIARQLGLSDEYCSLIRSASAMHDIGKIAVPEAILKKPGPLTPEERERMELHAEKGYRILAGSSSRLLQMAARIALTHHEWFDGSGYPHGQAGVLIPLEGRIASVADVFDALTRDRPYRPRLPLAEALATMREGSGTQFDPEVLDSFLSVVKTLQQSPDRHGHAGPLP